MKKPTLVLQKNAEQTTNKIRIPKKVVEELGSQFCMEVYEKEIILKPLEKKGK